ncbi:solute carrier family 19 member 1 [Homo sapiens]|uniref:Reduced folate transporter n=5 Tax=Homo sapiens TaxID=9606 RepID=S19A1_HUMAN|nr:reduced folate transporter isoform 1 [Homo sapiens]NP_919231.1 reduced folate transporter isoform 1 [Homo sapiens]XP_011528002.1 reduced folate transporter isoform X6 [Homo sapiens]XP_011528004.1 reduced folate transporter isoform X6 [Homo sapiens]XP_011528005.1 reduced folate transporter isoform X6 [Homo sapiens]XP_016883932.2 reduced folate transporter isoform X6 [Homo sapiens]XP_047296914.1 reduced folate transporter isoform X6 [Homo sapiens]XP_054189291.1 reduced folate transporter is|eukprot:NP_001339441.1 folate transporter 1 isoform 1 [Homo sapiens]
MVPSSPAVEKQVPVEPGPDPELRSWRHLVCYLCFYGFMAQIRPGESFITPYLLGPDKNFTREQVTNEITPVLSYSYLAVLVPVFLLTDYLRYTPVLLLQGLSFVSVWLLLLLGHSVAHMQLMELFYSVTMAARIAYSSYIFSLVRPARYQRVAGYSRAAVLLGVFTSSVLGQLLVTVGRVSFSTLNYISLAFLTFSVVLALFLKRPKRSLFFNRDDRGRCETSASELERMNPGPGGKLGHALRVACGDSVLARMLRELGDSLRRPQLRLWSLWWVFNSAGYYLVVYYVHILWNEVDPTTNSARVYNGAADAASTLLGAITSFAAGFVKIRWARWSKLLIAGVTATQAGLVFLLAHTRHPSSIWLCYAAFVLFRGSYQFLVPIATFQIASSLSKELCALVFGVNTFFATIVKTIITFIVSDVRGLGLPVRKQFQLYSVYFLILSIIYFLGAMLDGLRHCQRGHHPRQPPAQGLRSAAEEKAAQALSVQDKGLGGLQPAQSPPLSPEDSLGAVGPASLEQRQSDPYLAQAPAPQAAEFLSPVTTPSPCTLCSAQASGPEAADETCPQLAVHPPGVSKLGLQCLPSDGVQNVNQ